MLYSFEEHQPHHHMYSLSFQGGEEAVARFNYRPKTQRYNKKKFAVKNNKTLEQDTIERLSDKKALSSIELPRMSDKEAEEQRATTEGSNAGSDGALRSPVAHQIALGRTKLSYSSLNKDSPPFRVQKGEKELDESQSARDTTTEESFAEVTAES